jgi:hypothetical protein
MAASRTAQLVSALALGFALFTGSAEAAHPQPVPAFLRSAPISWGAGAKGLLLAVVAARLALARVQDPRS